MKMNTSLLVSIAVSALTSTGIARAQERTPEPLGRFEIEIPRLSVETPFTGPIDIEPMIVGPIDVQPALDQAQMALSRVPMALAQADMALAEIQPQLDNLGVRIFPGRIRGERYPRLERSVPREAWAQGDPADSVYKAARQALTDNDFRNAANLFGQLRQRYPKSKYVPDALYWEAFSRYRQGGEERLRTALDLLDQLQKQYPRAMGNDATSLATRVRGELARRGDPEAAEAVAAIAAEAAPATPAVPSIAVTPRRERTPRPPRAPRLAGDNDEIPAGCSADDYEDKVAALNALLQMNSERALPILKGLLARRDQCSGPLRRKAMFLVAQQKTPETADILLQAAKNDPDPEVRKQAVFWLGQVDDERAVDILGDILKTSADVETQKRAMFALSQHRSPRASQIIRDYAERADAPAELRKTAIFDIGQHQSAENATFLRNLYSKVTDEDLKERVLFSVSQMQGQGNSKWLLDIASNPKESIEMRKKALFWAGQQNETDFSTFSGLYDSMTDREMKRQLIYVYSQRSEPAALDRLVEIAQKEQDRELRKQAIFWLGQSRDPRVARILEDILNR